MKAQWVQVKSTGVFLFGLVLFSSAACVRKLASLLQFVTLKAFENTNAVI